MAAAGTLRPKDLYAAYLIELQQKVGERIARPSQAGWASRGVPGPGGHPIPYLRVQWDEAKLGLSYKECCR